MEKAKKRFEIRKLEERIAPSGCQLFGTIVSDVAHGDAGNWGIDIPDGPAQGSDVGNLKSFIGTGQDPDFAKVSERIHYSQDLACG